MLSFPADEPRIAEVERGRCLSAVVPLAPGESLEAGDPILFAQADGRSGQGPVFISGGDSVVVHLTRVLDLGRVDPATGHPLYQLDWAPIGQVAPPAPRARRPIRAHSEA